MKHAPAEPFCRGQLSKRSCTSSIKKEGKQSTTRCGTSSKAKLYGPSNTSKPAGLDKKRKGRWLLRLLRRRICRLETPGPSCFTVGRPRVGARSVAVVMEPRRNAAAPLATAALELSPLRRRAVARSDPWTRTVTPPRPSRPVLICGPGQLPLSLIHI